MVLTLCALCAFSQNLRINFYAQIDENKKVAPDSVLVENLASGYSKMIHKELSDDKSITIIGKWLDKPNTIGDEPVEQDFLCQKTKATVAVSMNRSAKLHLALYNISGTKITDYANDFGVGQYEFSVSAPIGIYVLTANDGVRSSSLKLSIEGYDNARIEEIAVENANNSILKSYHDTVKFYNIEDLRFTGYYNGLSDVQFFDISSFLLSEEIVFTFPFVKGEVKDITGTTAVLVGNTCNLKENTIIEKGFYFGTSYNPIEEGTKYIVETEEFSYMVENLLGRNDYRYCPYIVTDKCTILGSILSFTTEFAPDPEDPGIKDGAILAPFSVSGKKQVYFSMGNLWYHPRSGKWMFALKQYSVLGQDNTSITSDNGGVWIDLFGWGTSGWNSGANEYQPNSYSIHYNDYYPGGNYRNSLTGNYTNADWGVYNEIYNDKDLSRKDNAGMWRTLTSEEWYYLINTRKNASQLIGRGKIGNVQGLILLPDDWETPQSMSFSSDDINEYSKENWMVMQASGAVFLPAAGERNGTNVSNVNFSGSYWSSTAFDEQKASALYYYYNRGEVSVSRFYRDRGLAVRLVKDVK